MYSRVIALVREGGEGLEAVGVGAPVRAFTCMRSDVHFTDVARREGATATRDRTQKRPFSYKNEQ